MPATRGDERTTPPGEQPTDIRLLEVAERLFAEHGIDAVSLRSITIEAGANIAAVHYHFGTKLDLVRALVERRVDEVNAERLTMLREIERAGTVTARDIAELWIRPLARLALDEHRRSYLGFIAALDNAGPELRAMAGSVFRPHFARLDGALERALPHLDVATRRFRFTLLTATSMRALADLDAAAAPWRSVRCPATHDDVVDALVDALTGLLTGPPEPERPARAAGARTTRGSA
jgi:AcrR family transcriptional regulator